MSSLERLGTDELTIKECPHVQGNLMDLADFPCLNELNLKNTGVTGDVRDVGEGDFSTLESLILPDTVYGGKGCELPRISDALSVIRALYAMKKQCPSVWPEIWYGSLSEDSPDWYDGIDDDDDWGQKIPQPPLYIRLFQAGSRFGYRWQTANGLPCEIIWLVSEPERESADYEKYLEQLQEIEREVDDYQGPRLHYYNFFQGFHEPPSEDD